MKSELDEKLVKKYPIIFKDRYKDPQQTCMCWGFPGDGWYDLIDKLCWDITKIIEDYKIDVTAVQVKEKFGGLRFYVTISGRYNKRFLFWFENKLFDLFSKFKKDKYWYKYHMFRQKIFKTPSEKIFSLIEKAEDDSYKICESCGAKAKPRGKYYVVTLCDACWKKVNKESK